MPAGRMSSTTTPAVAAAPRLLTVTVNTASPSSCTIREKAVFNTSRSEPGIRPASTSNKDSPESRVKASVIPVAGFASELAPPSSPSPSAFCGLKR
jgi:hypothetical protein